MTTLPTLSWRESPNQSERHGVTPYLLVIHRPVGPYDAAISWLCNPAAQASAHVVSGHGVATQLVAWDRKAWACVAFNAASYNIEVSDDAWDGRDDLAWEKAARLAAFICHKTRIPARWSKQPTHVAGICRHYDLGLAGGGHTDPTTNDRLWVQFVAQVARELDRGGFRNHYGRGELVRM